MKQIGTWISSGGPNGLDIKYPYYNKRKKKGEGMARNFWCNQILILCKMIKEYRWINIDRHGIETWK